MSLKDELIKKGFIPQKDTKRSEKEKEIKESSSIIEPSINGITRYYIEKLSAKESYQESILHANQWLSALHDNGFRKIIEAEFGEREKAVELVADPISQNEIEDIERQFGFTLPPSYKDFLKEIGAVSFYNNWSDKTTSPMDLVNSSLKYLSSDVTFEDLAKEYPDSWRKGNPQIIRVCRYHGSDNHIICRNIRDKHDESPIFLVFHDDGEFYGGAPNFNQWFVEAVCGMMEYIVQNLPKGQ